LAAVTLLLDHREGRPEQEIAEIGGVRFAETLLIEGVDLGGVAKDLAIDRVAAARGRRDGGVSLRRRGFRRHEPVLEG